MHAEELREKLRAMVAEVAEVDEIPDATPFKDLAIIESTPFKDLGIDSMMAIEIIAEVERTYGIKVPEAELETITDLDSVVALVQAKVG